MSDFDEILKEFLVESYENLDLLDQSLVELEKSPSDPKILANIFRNIHTIKGTCGALGFSKLESVTHAGENLLSRLRDGEILLDREIADALLGMVDAVRNMLSSVESSGNEGETEHTELIKTLLRLASEERSTARTEPDGASRISASSSAPLYERLGGPEAITAVVARFYERVLADPQLVPFFTAVDMDWLRSRQVQFFTQALGGPAVYEGRDMKLAHAHLPIHSRHFERVAGHLVETLKQLGVKQSLIDEVIALVAPLASEIVNTEESGVGGMEKTPEPEDTHERIGEILVKSGHTQAKAVTQGLQEQDRGDPRRLGEILVEQDSVRPREVLDALNAQGTTFTPNISDTSIRVDVELLDKLMNLVGELVLTRNQILQFSTDQNGGNMLATSQRLNLITSELQEGVMKTRMQPIGNIWNKFPRVVRDLALSCNKQVRIEFEGSDTELDKTLIEAVKDPLMHLVRNAVDHGIETPQARQAAGKPVAGRLALHAYHEGGQVIIEISDDGAGIDPKLIKERALQKGIISAERAASLNEKELINLIFTPGFSTAEKVTNVSGRGVGMDVVKTNIEKIGGTIDLQNKLGQGITVKIKIPLTLAIIPALIVTSGGDRYAIAQASLVELVRVEGKKARQRIGNINGAAVYRLRGELLPLVYLNEQLHLSNAESGSRPDAAEDEVTNIVVLQAEDRQFGLVVNGINDTEEIVVKPLGKQLKDIPIFAGATIQGDGTVALILDVMGIAQCANVLSAVEELAIADSEIKPEEQADDRQSLLLVQSRDQGRMVIPLDLVARLEEFPRSMVERVGGQSVVQYRGQILPLIHVSDVLPERRRRPRSEPADESASESESIHVVVHNDKQHSIGLVVGQILDIVEESLTTKGAASRDGVTCTVVIQDKICELLDVPRVIQLAKLGDVDHSTAMKMEA